MNLKYPTGLLTVVLLLNGGFTAGAEEAPLKKWTDAAEASVVTTNGNSKAATTSIKNLFRYQWSKETTLELEGLALGSRSGDDVTAENYKASEKFTVGIMDRTYVYEKFTWDKDRFAGIANRYDGSVGFGRLIWDSVKNKLNGELGGGYVNEERTEAAREDYGSGRAYSLYEHLLSKTSKFIQDVEYLHNFENSKAYRLKTETALIASLTSLLSLKTSFLWKRNAVPPPGRLKDDTVTSAALVVNF